MTMKLLITGVCGFVGSELTKTWIAQDPGITIYGLDNLRRPGSEANRAGLRKLGVKVFHCDVRIASDMDTLPSVDWVIDAVAIPSVQAGIGQRETSRQLIEHNLIGTINLLEYCKKNSCGFILLSTSRVYSIKELSSLPLESNGKAFRLADDKQFPRGVSSLGISEGFSTQPPLSLYGSTKLASEILAQEYAAAFGFPVWINRCGVLAGAGQFGRPDQGIVSYWIHSWHKHRPLSYIGYGAKGYQTRDCLHPRDLLTLIRKQIAASGSFHERVYNVGGGIQNAFSLAELSAWCADRFGPHEIDSVAETRKFDVPWLIMNTSQAQKQFDWQPQTHLTQIFEEIAAHAEQHPEWLELSESL